MGERWYELEDTGVNPDKLDGYTNVINRRFGRLTSSIDTDGIEFSTDIEED